MNVGAYSAIILVPAWSCLVIITLTLMSPWARKTGEEEKRTIAQSKITEATVRLSVLNERIVLIVCDLFLFIIFPEISCWNISMKPKAKKISKKEIK